MSLRRKFVLALALFAALLAAGFSYLAWRIASDALEAELDRRALDVPRALVATNAFDEDFLVNFRPGIETDSLAPDYGRFDAYRARLDSLRAYVADAFVFDAVEKRALVTADSTVRTGDVLFSLNAFEDAVDRARRTGSATTRQFPDEEGRIFKYGFVRVGSDRDSPPILAVKVPAEFFEPLSRLTRTLVVGAVAALALAVLLAGLLAANIVRPLERLARVALRIQRGHLEREVELERGDELGRLSRAMERMRRGILERDEQLRLMLAQVAHEIRNPLGGLELFASAAAEAEEPDERRRLLGRVRSEIADLNRIIDDFLTFARPLTGDRSATDLRRPVQDAVDLVEAEIRERGVELEVRLPDGPVSAVADPDRVKRAVLNLLRNAVQAAEERVVLTVGARGTEVEISVRDDGPGIPEERRERVFDPFVTDKEKGAGLGLAIVRKVVESHDGRVEVHDAVGGELGAGTDFRLYFPGLEEPPPEQSHPQAAE